MPTIAGRRIRLSLTLKLIIIVDMALNIMLAYFLAYAWPQVDRKLTQERELRTQQQAEVAWNVIQYNYELETTGAVSRDDAQAQALAQMYGIVSGSDEADTIWIYDQQPVLLAGTTMTDRIDTNVSDVRDANGQPIFTDMLSISSTAGEGSYHYSWREYDGAGKEATASYVKSFEPWGWVVTSGTSIEDLTNVTSGWKWTLGWLGGLAGVVGLVAFYLVARSTVIKPLLSLKKTSEALALGDIDQRIEVNSNDEVGDMAASYAKVVDYMKEMAATTTAMADGDLTMEIKPRSEKDVLSHTFSRMAVRQRELIGGVKIAATSVAEASEHLSKASERTAKVTQQIANAVQQVAKGSGEQSASLQEIVANEQKLSRAIEQMASGSQEQAASSEEAARMVKQVSSSVAQVLQNAQAGTEAWKSTAKSAETGARTTYETVEGMKRIKDAIDLVSLRVADLGDRSKEIGSIVATIDDISAQTNLLALNAAIEAARAGDQGRGFAVVADEVRKLAERASIATKEIAALISSMQGGVSEAVKAMGRGGKEVEAGYGLAAEAGKALDDILERAQAAGKQVNQITTAAEDLNALSGNMVSVIQQISKTIDENAAATEAMAESSSMVTSAVESVGGVSEENTAAAEEVSASVEEMSAGVEEVLASAQSLAEMSGELEMSVATFKTAY